MKNTVKHIPIFLFLFLSINVFAQNELSGTVKDAKDNSTLPGVSVYIPDIKVGGASGKDGSYDIKNLPTGTYLVEVHLLGYADFTQSITIKGNIKQDFALTQSPYEENEVVVTGTSIAKSENSSPQPMTEASAEYLDEHSSTNVIDAIAQTPGVSAETDGQSISKPIIRGLGYNRVLTINDGVEQVDQAWFDEFGIEADPDAVSRYEVLKGPGSLAYGSDAIAGVVNLIPDAPLPAGQTEGDILFNYQNNNGLLNNMAHIAGTSLSGISWSARMDYTAAHAYQDPNDGYVLNSQFSNFNMDGTIGIHRKWGYTQLHASYFDMSTGIVDGTRDSATGIMERQVSYPSLNGGAPTYVIPNNQDFTTYTPFCINQRIRHSKIVWDNSIAVGGGRITGIFSYQFNQRQETNDPTMPNTPDIYYNSSGATYDVRYISPQMGGFNFSVGANGVYQNSQSLGTVQLIPNYNFIQVGGFAIGNYTKGKLNISGGIRYDVRTFNAAERWIDTSETAPQVPVAPNSPNSFEEFTPFTTTFSGVSGSIGATYDITKSIYVKANIARGWRAPSVAECGANGVHDGTVVYEIGDPTLNPETSLEEDVTFGMDSKDVTFELDLFNNSIGDFIYSKGLQSVHGGDSISNLLSVGGSLFPDAPVFKYTQGAAELYGGEIGLDIHPSAVPWIDFNTTLSMVYGGLQNVPDSIKYLPFVPPTRITADLKFPIKKISKGIRNAYVKVGELTCFQQSDIYEEYAIYNGLTTALTPFEYAASTSATAGYTIFNAGVGGDIFSATNHKVCGVYIICNNLFNTPYMDYESRFKYYPVNYTTDRVGVFNMGRNISFKLIIPIDFTNKEKPVQD
jgi:iron complex outermembrane recepter protein